MLEADTIFLGERFGWQPGEIRALPCSRRRRYVTEQIRRETEAASKSKSGGGGRLARRNLR